MGQLTKTMQTMDKPMKTMKNSIETIEKKNLKPVEKMMNSANENFSCKMQQMSDFSCKKPAWTTQKKKIHPKKNAHPLNMCLEHFPGKNARCRCCEADGSYPWWTFFLVKAQVPFSHRTLPLKIVVLSPEIGT